MTTQEIREAMKRCKRYLIEQQTYYHFKNDLNYTIFPLIDQYLAIEGFPEEKRIGICEYGCEPPYDAWAEEKGFNEALRLCKLAAMKQIKREGVLIYGKKHK